jgi:glycosyltransferase involved in cell wall biosynthesis
MTTSGGSRDVLVISHEVVGERMAGPGIRYYHMAHALASEFSVTLAVPEGSNVHSDGAVTVLPYDEGHVQALEARARASRVVVVPAVWVAKLPFLKSLPVPLAIDGYDPVIVEMLAMGAGGIDAMQERLKEAYVVGDFFICSSERQRDWWLGLLEANGRLNAENFRADPSLRNLIDVVPFGLPDETPVHSRQVVKGVWPGIGKADRVIVWGGGLWTWLDPLTGIKAIAKVWEQRPDVRLIFPGTRHPNPAMAQAPTLTAAARELAAALGLLDKAVFFGDWVPYADWPSVLLESDVGLVLHYDTVETRLSFRSRLFDYIWAGLPIVTSTGDATSEIVRAHGLGVVVGYRDVGGVSAAILRLLDGQHRPSTSAFDEARLQMSWGRATLPLLEFCRSARPARDKLVMELALSETNKQTPVVSDSSGSALSTDELFDKIRIMQSERDYWRRLVDRYDQGRFMRVMRRLHELANGWW